MLVRKIVLSINSVKKINRLCYRYIIGSLFLYCRPFMNVKNKLMYNLKIVDEISMEIFIRTYTKINFYL